MEFITIVYRQCHSGISSSLIACYNFGRSFRMKVAHKLQSLSVLRMCTLVITINKLSLYMINACSIFIIFDQRIA
jgi:hypothetical protein